MPRVYTTVPAEDRFWAKVDRSGGPDACWLWTAAKTANGYGLFGIATKQLVYAHRFAYELAYGPVPAGLFVCHRCDVRHCCNSAHLFAGTQEENIADARSKGRLATGERNGGRLYPERNRFREHRAHGSRTGTSRLSEDDVREIRRAYAAHEASQYVLAARFGVSQPTISVIVRGKGWLHVTDQ